MERANRTGALIAAATYAQVMPEPTVARVLLLAQVFGDWIETGEIGVDVLEALGESADLGDLMLSHADVAAQVAGVRVTTEQKPPPTTEEISAKATAAWEERRQARELEKLPPLPLDEEGREATRV